MSTTIIHGDCLEELKKLEDNSIDAVVCDPPYGLSNTKPQQVADVLKAWVTGDTEAVPTTKVGFMGASWDSFVPPPAVWEECMRVLKPGGHMAVFAGARTQDLMGLSIRLAGFEIRDTLGWVYGSGMPKSLDVSKAIDKKRDDNNDWKTIGSFLKSHRVSAGYATRNSFADKILNGHSNLASAAANLSNWENGLSFPTWERWEQLKGLLDLPDDMDAEVWRLNGRKGTPGEAWEKREVVGKYQSGLHTGPSGVGGHGEGGEITTASSDAAKQWDGWGTNLKPAIEPILLCRKPLDGTVANNVLAHGVGGLNIDACRVDNGDFQAKKGRGIGTLRLHGCSTLDELRHLAERGEKCPDGRDAATTLHRIETADDRMADWTPPPPGRFPANVLLDEHAAKEMDKQAPNAGANKVGNAKAYPINNHVYGAMKEATPFDIDEKGGASRFFPVFKYQAKAPKRERPVIEREDGTKIQHSTVKPLALMSWLVELITPPGGVVLDPFAGSGTTLQAAINKGFTPIGIEQDADYIKLIEQRLAA